MSRLLARWAFDTEELPFAYETRTTARTRRLRVTVYPGGRIVLSRPRLATERGVLRFLRAHAPWIMREAERMQGVVPQPRLRGPRREYLLHKEAARALISERLAHWSARYGYTHGRVAIKNMSSRWGSCSSKGNLNFHYRVVELTPALLDYLVVHEVCHLKEMNHGPHFWALVAREIPDYERLRTQLRMLYR